MRLYIIRAILAGLLTVGFCSSASAQSTNATLSGVVADSQGAVIPNAAVVATQVDTGQSRNTQSGSDGHYTIPDLPIGNYRIAASSPGFKTLVIPSVTLQVNQSAVIRLTLAVGSTSEQVVVTEQVPLLNT
ncbi:MAG: carboxypeptidase-like regulatory domain-containing protein, partial [Acidobacteriaceae bacterium]